MKFSWKIQWSDVFSNCLKVAVFSIWASFFVNIIKPYVADFFVPKILTYTENHAMASKGVDLDPVIFDSDDYSDAVALSSLNLENSSFGDEIYGNMATEDTRVIALHLFLIDYNSPMAPYAAVFVEAADQAGLDWRLLPAIAGVESAFGRIIPTNSYNAWGWKGAANGDFSSFSSWEEAIRYITAQIAIGYGTDIDVFVMEPTYCPPCGLNPAHSWANGVSRYMNEITLYRNSL